MGAVTPSVTGTIKVAENPVPHSQGFLLLHIRRNWLDSPVLPVLPRIPGTAVTGNCAFAAAYSAFPVNGIRS